MMSDTESVASTSSDTPPPVGFVEIRQQQEDNNVLLTQSAHDAEQFVMRVVADRAQQARKDLIAAQQRDEDHQQQVEGVATEEGVARERGEDVKKASYDPTSCEKKATLSVVDYELERLSSRLHEKTVNPLSKKSTQSDNKSKTLEYHDSQDVETGKMQSREDSAPAAAERSVSRPGAVHVSNPLGSSETDETMGTYQDDHQSNSNNEEDSDSDCDLAALSAHLVNEYDDDSDQGDDELSAEAHTLDMTNSERFGDLGFDEGTVVEGEKVVPETPGQPWFLFASLAGISFLMLIILLLVLGLAGVFDSAGEDDLGLSHNNDNMITPVPLSKLERIRQEGVLKCAYNSFGSSPFEETLCKVIAAAIMGEAAEVDFISLPLMDQRFEALAKGEIDVLIRVITHTMERDIHEAITGSAFAFSTPYMYDGMKIAGKPFFVQCAENNLKHIEECSDLKVCVHNGSIHTKTLSEQLPERYILPIDFLYTGKQFVMEQLATGTCNVVAMESETIAEYLLGSENENNFTVTERYFTKDPLSMVTSSDDPEFSDFVNAVLEALLVAEQHEITQDQAASFPTTAVFGENYQNMFQNAIAVGGHFGELYERLKAEELPRDSLNRINDGASGLIFSHPFGLVENDRRGKPLGRYMQRILDRGFLRCGLPTGRPGFAQELANGIVSGMDAEYCCAVAAALFQGDKTKVEFVQLASAADGFPLLVEGFLDLVAGASRTLENDVREPSTGLGFAFSQPYFYGQHGDNLSLATRQEDKDWSSFVYWIVGASFYAEENSITSALANPMPEVFVFGQRFHRMFRDSVLAAGSYSEMYDRNLEPIIPRSGRNQLNAHPNLGPQHYPLPGFFLSE